MKLKMLFLASLMTIGFAVTLENNAEAKQVCMVNRYFACNARCRSAAWLKAPRRCKLFISMRNVCQQRYEGQFRICMRKQRAWGVRVACFRRARNNRTACNIAQWKRSKYIHNNLRWHCKGQCGRWRPACVRRCVASVRSYCNAWSGALMKKQSKCYNGCRRKFCWFQW